MSNNKLKIAKIRQTPFTNRWVCLTKWKDEGTYIKKMDPRCEYDVTDDINTLRKNVSQSLIEFLIKRAKEEGNIQAEDFLKYIYDDGITLVVDENDPSKNIEILPKDEKREFIE